MSFKTPTLLQHIQNAQVVAKIPTFDIIIHEYPPAKDRCSVWQICNEQICRKQTWVCLTVGPFYLLAHKYFTPKNLLLGMTLLRKRWRLYLE